MTQAITRSGKISNMSELCTYLCDPLCCHPVSSVVGKVSPTCLKHEVCCGRARVSHTEKNMSRLTLRRCQFPIRSADQFRSCAQSFAQKQQLWTSEVAIFTCMTHKDRGHSAYTLRLGYLWRHKLCVAVIGWGWCRALKALTVVTYTKAYAWDTTPVWLVDVHHGNRVRLFVFAPPPAPPPPPFFF